MLQTLLRAFQNPRAMDWERKPSVSFPYYAWVDKDGPACEQLALCYYNVKSSDVGRGKQGSICWIYQNVVLFFAVSVMLQAYLKGESDLWPAEQSLKAPSTLLFLNFFQLYH